MIETASQMDVKAMEEKIASLHHFFQANGDEETAEKAKQLLIKLHHQEYAIAFCGHFSAGKSSMINRIIGENLLPSSPIPTSANLVKIKSGKEYARVNFKEGNPLLYPAPYNYEKVKTYCKDGDSIQSIEISHATDKLPADACIMDTPGIDSTDDAHALATESALHLADLVFYVMDYNHVQSELNFLFTRELTQAGKEVYLVINQIDKHREDELSFAEFQTSVKDSFAAWGVQPAEIFYTSLKEEQHLYNDFSRLQQFIHSKWDDRASLLKVSVLHSLRKLTEEHDQFLKARDQEQLDSYEAQLAELPVEEQDHLPERVEELSQALNNISSVLERKEQAFDEAVESILKNAYLMPFETRELAEKYLQSAQDDFKVGLFFSKQKTEQERQVRLERFFTDFKEKVTSQLTWHLKELLNRTVKEEEINDSVLLSRIQDFSVPITMEDLAGAVKSGARLSGEYVLHYTAEVAENAKKVARQQSRLWGDAYLELLRKQFKQESLKLEKELAQYTLYLDAWKGKQLLLELQTASMIRMEQMLNGELIEQTSDLAELLHENVQIEIVNKQEMEEPVEQERVKEMFAEEEAPTKNNHSQDAERRKSTVQKLRKSAQALISIPGFKKISNLLLEKADRLEKQSFTVALFGAFSAGKSSFANSLIGEKLLPVSPNPTTAAINKIMPTDENNPHGTVKVRLKSKAALFNDVARSLAAFDRTASDFDEALTQINRLMDGVQDLDVHDKTHFSFLAAFHKGFEAYRNSLGETLITDVTTFREFVANEEKSCLVDLIEVHYDCELTRKGITLVDTPGADSINARHTGVAFDYIKNSDAILFVTYYNHAFSKADREFLIQLGRVKDSFELDKMFFIVNAVDLANSEEEKNDVLTYVHDQLVLYGIRKPTLFPVSSLLAIKEKEEGSLGHSGIQAFEESFYSFITHDLSDMAINSSLVEWERGIEQLRTFIHSASEGNELKQRKKLALEKEHHELQELLKKADPDAFVHRLHQEIEELTFYIKQRVFFRFNDFFKESFNPTVLRDDGRNLKKALQQALEEFLLDFGFDFAQELRATTLRIEAFMAKLLDEYHQAMTKDLCKLNEELSFSRYQMKEIDTLSFEQAFQSLDRDLFKKVLSLFKNPKAFFEKNEKRFLQDALNEVLQQPSEQYINEEKERLKTFYTAEFEKEFQALLQQFLEESTEYYEGMYATLSNNYPVEELIEIERELKG